MESGKKNLEKGQNQETAPAPAPVPKPSTSKGSSTGSKPSRPRRGRPTGANRTPLSLEERRARNAQYERERREDLAQAQAELAEAAGCDPNVSEADLLAFVVNKLSADKLEVKQSIEEYRRLNAKLEAQIASCLLRLGPDYVDSDDEEEVQLEEPNNRKRKSSDGTTGDEKRLRRSGKQIPASWISPTDLAEAGPSSYTHTAAHPQQSQPTSLSPVVSVQQDTIDQVLADLSDFSQLEKSDNDQLAPPVTECQSPAQYPSSLPGGSEQQQPEQQRPTSPRVHPYLLRGILAKLGYYSQLETSDNDQLVPPVTEYQSQDQYFAPQRYSDCDLQPTEQLQQQPTSPPVQPDLLEVEADLGLSSQLETSDNDQLAAPVTESPSQDQYFAPQQYLLPSSLPGGSEQQQPEQQQLRGILAYLGYYSSEPEPSLANQLAQPVTEYQSAAQYFAPQQCLLPSSLPGGSEQQQTEQLQQQQQQQPDLLEVSADLGYYSSELEPSPLYHQSQSYFYHHQNRYS